MTEGELVKLVLSVLLFGVVLAVTRQLLCMSRDEKSRFNFEDLVLGDDGRASKSAVTLWIGVFISSWVVVYLTLRNRLEDTIFWAYLLLIAPHLAVAWTAASKRGDSPPADAPRRNRRRDSANEPQED